MEERYIVSAYISGGTSGSVFLARDQTNETNVAIKAIRFMRNKPNQYKRPFREISILKHINSRFCLTILYSYAVFNENELSEVRFVLPYIEYDLKKVITKYNLVFKQIMKIIYQILMGLSYLHDCGIIHRDLKPSNIAINEDLDLTILDFGLARDKQHDMTEYVVTRYYRPFEISCMWPYTTAVDMWSAGCIFAEMLTNELLFSGKSQIDQTQCILEVLGWPDDDMINKMNPNVREAVNQFRVYAAPSNQLENKIKAKINECVYREDDGNIQDSNDAMALLIQMLELNPDKRINPINAIKSELFGRNKSIISSYVESGTTKEYRSPNYPEDADEDFWKDLLLNEIDDIAELNN